MATRTIQQEPNLSWTDDELLYIIAEANLRKVRQGGQNIRNQLAAIMRRLLRCSAITDLVVKSDRTAELGGQLKAVLERFARTVRRAGKRKQAKRIERDARKAGTLAGDRGISLAMEGLSALALG